MIVSDQRIVSVGLARLAEAYVGGGKEFELKGVETAIVYVL
jgi:hypothetical protein